jgi:hypothetical protein
VIELIDGDRRWSTVVDVVGRTTTRRGYGRTPKLAALEAVSGNGTGVWLLCGSKCPGSTERS